jgi:hypothetical protein
MSLPCLASRHKHRADGRTRTGCLPITSRVHVLSCFLGVDSQGMRRRQRLKSSSCSPRSRTSRADLMRVRRRTCVSSESAMRTPAGFEAPTFGLSGGCAHRAAPWGTGGLPRPRTRCPRSESPVHVVVGPNGSYLMAWCHLRQDDRVFRMDRIVQAEVTSSLPLPRRVAPEPVVDGHVTKQPASALRPEVLAPNTDIGLSRAPGSVEATRQGGG